jgi:hypothetical protein
MDLETDEMRELIKKMCGARVAPTQMTPTAQISAGGCGQQIQRYFIILICCAPGPYI